MCVHWKFLSEEMWKRKTSQSNGDDDDDEDIRDVRKLASTAIIEMKCNDNCGINLWQKWYRSVFSSFQVRSMQTHVSEWMDKLENAH